MGARGQTARKAWEARFATLSEARQADFTRAFAREMPKKLAAAIRALKKSHVENAPKIASRTASQLALEVINPILG